MKILLLGYSGKRNFGDDLLLLLAYERIAKEGIPMTIHTSETSEHSDYLYEWFPKAQIIKNTRILLETIKEHSHVLYFGGGVFFDYNRIDNIQFLKRIYEIIRLILIPKFVFGVKFAGIGIGLGPFLTSRAELLYKIRLKLFDFLNVRDSFSMEKGQLWGLKNISQSPDLSFCFMKGATFKNRRSNKENVLICPREFPHGKKGNMYLDNLILLCKEFISQGLSVTIFAFQSNHDEAILRKFDGVDVTKSIWNPDEMKPLEVFYLFSQMDYVVTARMHGIFVAGMVGTPSIGIGVHPKLEYASSFFKNSVTVSENYSIAELKHHSEKIRKEFYGERAEELSVLMDKCDSAYNETIQWLRK